MKMCKWCGREIEDKRGDECDVCWELRTKMLFRETNVILKILVSILEQERQVEE